MEPERIAKPLNERLPEYLLSSIHQAIGAASMAWVEPPTAVFDSNRASEIAVELCHDVADWKDRELVQLAAEATRLAEERERDRLWLDEMRGKVKDFHQTMDFFAMAAKGHEDESVWQFVASLVYDRYYYRSLSDAARRVDAIRIEQRNNAEAEATRLREALEETKRWCEAFLRERDDAFASGGSGMLPPIHPRTLRLLQASGFPMDEFWEAPAAGKEG